jgi:phenylpropionate dioxygenase-like ring-hydroxylating dioxygenase large terminal subunit
MIPNQWYAVLESNEVPARKPVGVLRMGEKLVFWRDAEGKLACLHDRCPHRGVSLSLGRLQGNCVECPFHGFQFDASGGCRLVPANGRSAPAARQIRVASYPTYEIDGLIFIWWGEANEIPPPPLYFDNLGGLVYASSRVPWNAHYSRAIENQLDVAHLPFVHADTIGRGAGAVVDGPYLEWDGTDKFRLYFMNRYDDGRPALRPEQVTRPNTSFWLEMILPNIWQNHLGDQARVTVAFAPVDNEHTMMYLRFYQGFLKAPILGKWIAHLSMPFNRRVLRQDQRVVETQMPRRSELKIGEKLVQADYPIIAYRRRREELIESTRAV